MHRSKSPKRKSPSVRYKQSNDNLNFKGSRSKKQGKGIKNFQRSIPGSPPRTWHDVRENLNSARSYDEAGIRGARELSPGKVAKMGILRATDLQAACVAGALTNPNFNPVSTNPGISERCDGGCDRDNGRVKDLPPSSFQRCFLSITVGWEKHDTASCPVRNDRVDWEGVSLQILIHESMFRWPVKFEMWGQGPCNKGHLIGSGNLEFTIFVDRPTEWVNAVVPLKRKEQDQGDLSLKLLFVWFEDIGTWDSVAHPVGSMGCLADDLTLSSGNLGRHNGNSVHNKVTFWNFKASELPWDLVERGAKAYLRFRLGWSETSTQPSKFKAGQQIWRWREQQPLYLPFTDEQIKHIVEVELWEEGRKGQDDQLVGVGVLQINKFFGFPLGDTLKFEISLNKGEDLGAVLEIHARMHKGDGHDDLRDDAHSVVSDGVMRRNESRKSLNNKPPSPQLSHGGTQTSLSVSAYGRIRDLRQQAKENFVGTLNLSQLFMLGIPELDHEERRGFQSMDPYVLIRAGNKYDKTEIKVNSGQDCHWTKELVIPVTEEVLQDNFSIEVWCDRDPLADRLISCGRVNIQQALNSEEKEIEVRLFTPQGKWGGMLRFEAAFQQGNQSCEKQSVQVLNSNQAEEEQSETRGSALGQMNGTANSGVVSTRESSPALMAESAGATAHLHNALRMLHMSPGIGSPTQQYGKSQASTQGMSVEYQYMAILSLIRLGLSSARQMEQLRESVDVNRMMLGLRHEDTMMRRANSLLLLLLTTGSPQFQQKVAEIQPGFEYKGAWLFGLPKSLFHHYSQMRKAAFDVYEVETQEGEVLNVGYQRLQPKGTPNFDTEPYVYPAGTEVYILPNPYRKAARSPQRHNKRWGRVLGVESASQAQFTADEFYEHLKQMLSQQVDDGLSRCAITVDEMVTVQYRCWPPVYLNNDIQPDAKGIQDSTTLLVARTPDPQVTLLGFDLIPGALVQQNGKNEAVYESAQSFFTPVSGLSRQSSIKSFTQMSLSRKSSKKSIQFASGQDEGSSVEQRIYQCFSELCEQHRVTGPLMSTGIPIESVCEQKMFHDMWTSQGVANLINYVKGRTEVCLKDLLSYHKFVLKKLNQLGIETPETSSQRPQPQSSFEHLSAQDLGPTVIYKGKAFLPAWEADDQGLALKAMPHDEYPPKMMELIIRADIQNDELVISAVDLESATDLHSSGWSFYAHIGRAELEIFLGHSLRKGVTGLLQLNTGEITSLVQSIALPVPGTIDYNRQSHDTHRTVGALRNGMILLRLMGSPAVQLHSPKSPTAIFIPSLDPNASASTKLLSTRQRCNKVVGSVVKILLDCLDEHEQAEENEAEIDGVSRSSKTKRRRNLSRMNRLEKLQESSMKCIRSFNLFIQTRIRERVEKTWWGAGAQGAIYEGEKELALLRAQSDLSQKKNIPTLAESSEVFKRGLRAQAPQSPSRQRKQKRPSSAGSMRRPSSAGSSRKPLSESFGLSENANGAPNNDEESRMSKKMLDKLEQASKVCRNILTEAVKHSKLLAYKRQPKRGCKLLVEEMGKVLKELQSFMKPLRDPFLKTTSRSLSEQLESSRSQTGSLSTVTGVNAQQVQQLVQEVGQLPFKEDAPTQTRRKSDDYRVHLGNNVYEDRAEFNEVFHEQISDAAVSRTRSPITKKHNLEANRKMQKETMKNIRKRESLARDALRSRIQQKMNRIDRENAKKMANQQALRGFESQQNLLNQQSSPSRSRGNSSNLSDRERWYAANELHRQQRIEARSVKERRRSFLSVQEGW